VKLRSSATTAKAASVLSSSRGIVEVYGQKGDLECPILGRSGVTSGTRGGGDSDPASAQGLGMQRDAAHDRAWRDSCLSAGGAR
jgi:hypothetical protein